MVKVITDDKIIIEAINFIFTTRRIYIRENDTWFNKKLNQRIKNKDWGKYTDRELIYGRNDI